MGALGKPDTRFITLETGPEEVTQLLDTLFAKPRREIMRWSRITGQTAQVRIAYPGQHLASMITGVRGSGTAARGIDLADGSEVKSCSRADQLGSCKDPECLAPVLPHEDACSQCGGSSIKRKTDSHWILAIKSKQELEQYLAGPRIVLILFDRDEDEPASVRIRAWEVWADEARHAYFDWFLTNYYEQNFLVKTKAGLVPAPCNLHPGKFDFFMMNPVLTFEAYVDQADSEEAAVRITHFLDPTADRGPIEPEPMPARALRGATLVSFLDFASDATLARSTGGAIDTLGVLRLKMQGPRGMKKLATALTTLDGEARLEVPMPEKKIKMTPSTYRRRRARS